MDGVCQCDPGWERHSEDQLVGGELVRVNTSTVCDTRSFGAYVLNPMFQIYAKSLYSGGANFEVSTWDSRRAAGMFYMDVWERVMVDVFITDEFYLVSLRAAKPNGTVYSLTKPFGGWTPEAYFLPFYVSYAMTNVDPVFKNYYLDVNITNYSKRPARIQVNPVWKPPYGAPERFTLAYRSPNIQPADDWSGELGKTGWGACRECMRHVFISVVRVRAWDA